MSGPSFISEDAILAIHEIALREHGGPEGHKPSLVASIAAYPQQKAAYADPEPTLADLAAAYAFAAAKFHAFTDGNKRVALALAGIFLMENGYELTAEQDEAAQMVEDLAAGEMEEADFAIWIRDNAQRLID